MHGPTCIVWANLTTVSLGAGAPARQVYYVSHEILSEKEEEVLEFMKGQVPDGVTVAEITAVRRTPPRLGHTPRRGSR